MHEKKILHKCMSLAQRKLDNLYFFYQLYFAKLMVTNSVP